MTINKKATREDKEVKATKKALLEYLQKFRKYCDINCQYNRNLDQFSVYCFIDKNDDDAFDRIKYSYEDALNLICDVTVN